MAVSILFVIDSVEAGDERADRMLGETASIWSRRKREVTLKLSGERARQIARAGRSEMIALLKSQDVGFWGTRGRCDAGTEEALTGLDWHAGVRDFLARQTDGYESLSFLAGRIPSCYGNEGWIPQSIGGLAQWGVRVFLGKRSFLRDDDRPFFLGGRLHVSSLGPNWIELGPELAQLGAADRQLSGIIDRAKTLASTGGGLICVRLYADDLFVADTGHSHGDGATNARSAITNLDRILDGLIVADGLEIASARQVSDYLADISYEHAVPLEVLKRFAGEIAEQKMLTPQRYHTGYLSPAELLYLISAAWLASHEKGKSVRNVVWKSPLGPAVSAQTDDSLDTIPAAELPATLGAIVTTVNETAQLPASVAVGMHTLAIEDLLATLSAGFKDDMAIRDLPVRRGQVGGLDRIDEVLARECWRNAGFREDSGLAGQLELARCQLWTYKPVAF